MQKHLNIFPSPLDSYEISIEMTLNLCLLQCFQGLNESCVSDVYVHAQTQISSLQAYSSNFSELLGSAHQCSGNSWLHLSKVVGSCAGRPRVTSHTHTQGRGRRFKRRSPSLRAGPHTHTHTRPLTTQLTSLPGGKPASKHSLIYTRQLRVRAFVWWEKHTRGTHLQKYSNWKKLLKLLFGKVVHLMTTRCCQSRRQTQHVSEDVVFVRLCLADGYLELMQSEPSAVAGEMLVALHHVFAFFSFPRVASSSCHGHVAGHRTSEREQSFVSTTCGVTKPEDVFC